MSKKLFLTKRSLFLFLTLTFVGLIGVFKGPIFHFALRTYVSYKIPMEGAWGFDYSYISLSDQGIAFHDIQLCCEEKDASIMIGKVICQAPAIENISFSNHYIIEDLDIKFAKKFSSQKQKNSLNLKSLIGSLKNLEITNGTISIPGESLDFSLGKSVSPQKAGEIVFSKKNQGQVRCVLSSWADRFIIDLEAKRSFLPFYKKFADFFMSEKTGYWEVEKGRMDGRAFLAISDTSIKDMRVHMNLMDAKFSNENLGMVSSFDRVFVDLHYPTSSEEKGFIENIKINSSVDKGELAVFHENGGHRFCLKDISGFVSVSSFKEAAVEISGFVDDQERLLPVKLVGKPAHVNRSGLELDLDLQLDPLFGEKASVNLVCLHQDGDFTLTSRLDSLKVNQMLILQVGLGLLNPEFRDYTIHNGTYSGDIHVVFNQHGLKDFSLRDLSCKNLGIYSGKHDIRVEADSVSGECGIDLFEKKKTILSDWQMEMKNGKCIIGQEEKEPLYLTDIDMDVALKNGRFVESKVSGQGRGISANVEIEGSGEAPQFEIKAKSKGTDFLKCFVSGPKEYDNQVLLSCHIEKEGEDYVSSGILSVLDTDLVNDLNFEIKGNKIADLEYRFSSDEISGRLYPFMNEVFKFNWSVEGTYGVKGSYKNQKLSCDFSGKGATYREVHSFIKEAEGTAKFVKDFTDNTYVVDVHLTKGHKKVIAGKRMDLQNAHLRISSDESYFKVRDFLGKVDFDEVGLNLLVRGNRFDIFENGTCLFDMQLEKENLEIMRLIGNFEDQKISLGSLSHFLDAPVYLKLCDFSSSFNLMLESDINFDEVPFPKIVRDQKIGKRAALISVNDFNYKVFLDNDFFVLKGDSEGFEVNMQDMALKGRIDEGVLSLEGTEFSYQGYNILMNSAEINHHEAVFNGKVKNDDFEFSGLVLWNLLQGQHFEGRGKGKYTTGDYKIVSMDDFNFRFDEKGVIEDGSFKIYNGDTELGQVSAGSIILHNKGKKISVHGAKGKAYHEKLSELFNLPKVKEDFVFTAEADLFLEENDFWVSSKIDTQTIEFNSHMITAKNIHARATKSSLSVDFTWPLYDEEVDVSSHFFLDGDRYFHVEGNEKGEKVLDVYGSLNEKPQIFRLKGNLVGIDFELTPDEMMKDSIFRCEVGLDLKKMNPILPVGVNEFVDRIGLGKGMEVVGDLDIKEGIKFTGCIKGTDFDFLDKYSLSSLFGKLHYQDGLCTLSEFSVADRSLIAECKEAIFNTKGEGCKFNTKNFAIRDLRPCLLSEKGERKKVVNPFLLKTIDINDIHGDLADLDTLKGKGNLTFINSFERQLNPVFEFAKEIIGRIGLDPVLMIPVEGELTFTLQEQKFMFSKLQDTYSDKRRSYFYLWNKVPSYIDFDGNIHLDIRMKQHALLKFTELFIISLDGPISNPKIYLK